MPIGNSIGNILKFDEILANAGSVYENLDKLINTLQLKVSIDKTQIGTFFKFTCAFAAEPPI